MLGSSISIASPNTNYQLVTKTVTFAGATPNGIGDESGSANPSTVFTVTGDVIVKIIAVCATNIVHAANAAISLGIDDGAQIIAATDLTVQGMAAREIWHDATPDAEIEALSTMKEFIITDGNDIDLDVSVADVNTGAITFYCMYTPLSPDGAVTAA